MILVLSALPLTDDRSTFMAAAMIKHPGKKQLEEEGLISAHCSWSESVVAGKAGHQELDTPVPSHPQAEVERHKRMCAACS